MIGRIARVERIDGGFAPLPDAGPSACAGTPQPMPAAATTQANHPLESETTG